MSGSGMMGMGSASASPASSPAGESSAGPAATPSPGAMEEHMKGMEHMHSMMHGGEAGTSPQDPGGLPMEHEMGDGMSGGDTQGGANNSGQPQARPSGGMGGGMHDDM